MVICALKKYWALLEENHTDSTRKVHGGESQKVLSSHELYFGVRIQLNSKMKYETQQHVPKLAFLTSVMNYDKRQNFQLPFSDNRIQFVFTTKNQSLIHDIKHKKFIYCSSYATNFLNGLKPDILFCAFLFVLNNIFDPNQ